MKKWRYEQLVFVGFCVILTAIMTFCSVVVRWIATDFSGHISFTLTETAHGLNLWHDLVLSLYKMGCSPEYAAITVTALLELLFVAVIVHYLNKYLPEERVGAKLLALAVLGIGAAPTLLWKPIFYLGIGGMNTWHNPTSFATKPFTIVCFFAFAEFIEKFGGENKQQKKALRINWLLLAISAYLAAWGKISGIQSLLFGIVLYSVSWWCSKENGKRLDLAKFRHLAISASAFIPAGMLCLFSKSEYEAHGWHLVFVGFGALSVENILKLLWVLMFPIFAISVRGKKAFQSKLLRLGWLSYATSWIFAKFFAEVSPSDPTGAYGNTGWGLHYALIMLIFASVIEFSKLPAENSRRNEVLVKIGNSVLGYYLISGLLFIAAIFIRQVGWVR